MDNVTQHETTSENLIKYEKTGESIKENTDEKTRKNCVSVPTKMKNHEDLTLTIRNSISSDKNKDLPSGKLT